MNPTDLGLSSSDLSLLTLFWQAHWIVKSVMIGLLVCSVWVWAIAIEKTLLHMRMRTAMDRFEQAFWSGQSLEELYRSLSARPTHSMAALFVAAMGTAVCQTPSGRARRRSIASGDRRNR